MGGFNIPISYRFCCVLRRDEPIVLVVGYHYVKLWALYPAISSCLLARVFSNSRYRTPGAGEGGGSCKNKYIYTISWPEQSRHRGNFVMASRSVLTPQSERWEERRESESLRGNWTFYLLRDTNTKRGRQVKRSHTNKSPGAAHHQSALAWILGPNLTNGRARPWAWPGSSSNGGRGRRSLTHRIGAGLAWALLALPTAL